MKVPRDISAEKLIQALSKLGYQVTRQKGSHVRLTAKINSEENHLTIPIHSPIKIGTLNKILKDITEQNKMNKEELLEKLF
jgi:predicted RNA binding protein YcfA (HicA-like mRNA interferase family)